MRVVLVNPNVDKQAIYGNVKDVGNYVQPLGIGYLAAVLRENAFDVKVVDAQVNDFSTEQTVKEVKRLSPDLVGFTAATAMILGTMKTASALKKELDVPVVLGGAHVTSIPKDKMIYDYFDAGVIGEGELTVLELAKRVEKGKSVKDKKIDGISFKKGKRIVFSKPRQFIKDLDSLPFPARDLFPPLSAYKPTPASCRKTPLGSLITSRGCPFKCIYCDRAIFGNQFRARSPQNVVEEIIELKEKFGAREIKFWDDTMNFDKKRLIEICKLMVKEKIGLPWSCLARINFVDRETLHWMKKAGCWQVLFGIESGNNEVLRKIKKSLTVEMIRAGVKATKDAGMEVRGSFMLGLPSDTRETMQQTIDLARSLPLDHASFYITTLYPNTDLWHYAMKSGEAVKQDWDKFSPVNPDEITFVPVGLTAAELKEFQKKAYKHFYLRPGFMLKKLLSIRSLDELKINVVGMKSIFRF